MKLRSGEIQAHKKVVSKCMVLLLVIFRIFSSHLVMKCYSWFMYVKSKLTLTFKSIFAGLTTFFFFLLGRQNLAECIRLFLEVYKFLIIYLK